MGGAVGGFGFLAEHVEGAVGLVARVALVQGAGAAAVAAGLGGGGLLAAG